MARFNYLLIILLSLIPLITFQGRFEAPKVFIFLCFGIILIFYYLLNPQNLILTKRDVWYLAWLLLLTVSNPNLFGGSYRNQGVVFFVTLWLVIKFVESLNLKSKGYLYKFFGVTILIQSTLVILGYKLGTIGDINAVSGFIALGIYFVFKYLPKWLTIFPVFAMLIDFSKAGFLSLIPYLLNKKNIIYVLFIVPVIFMVKPINLSSPFENRGVIWKHAINLIKEKPIFGYGLESNEILFDKAFYESGFPLSNLIIDRSHNLFLDVTLWSGIVGLILFTLFLFEVYKSIDYERRKVFFAFLIFSMFQPLSVAHWILFAMIL